MNNYKCGCERGDNCTKTTMCAIQLALEDQGEEIERLTAELEADDKDSNYTFGPYPDYPEDD